MHATKRDKKEGPERDSSPEPANGAHHKPPSCLEENGFTRQEIRTFKNGNGWKQRKKDWKMDGRNK